MQQHFQMFAAYNRWANSLVYDAAGELDVEALNRDVGGFFGSLFATMTHILVADRIWLQRFTGEGLTYRSLDARPYETLAELREARQLEDARIIAWVDGLSDTELQSAFTYTPVSNPTPVTQRLAPAVSHFFNHQTHHRGQCHMALTALGRPSLALDLIYFLRQQGQDWL